MSSEGAGEVPRTAAAEGRPSTSERLHANTFDVHRVLRLANRQGRGIEFFETVQRRCFAGQLNPYEHDSLLAADVRHDEDTGRRPGITGVPFVLLDQRYAIAGAQSAEVYARAVEQLTVVPN